MRIVPSLLAVVVAGSTAWRWRRLGWALRVAGVALTVALAVYGAGVVHPPQLDDVVATIGSTLGPYTYALVAVMVFLEAGAFVGLLVPGETVVIVGDLTGYALGRRLGRRFLLAHGPRVDITEPRLLQVEAFFARYGSATILIGRFVGLVRPVAPFLAGASRFPPGRFAALAVIGTGLWSATFVLLGFVFWQSLDEAIAIAKHGSLALGAAVVLVVGSVAGHRYLRSRERARSALRVRSEESG